MNDGISSQKKLTLCSKDPASISLFDLLMVSSHFHECPQLVDDTWKHLILSFRISFLQDFSSGCALFFAQENECQHTVITYDLESLNVFFLNQNHV